VVSPAWGLWILAPLVVVFAAAQRWLGRVATVIVAVFGHVGATLFVAVLLAAGINDGVVDADLARVPDVGVSYGLAAVAGVLAGRVPRRWRLWYALGVLAVAGGTLLLDADFTGVGHLTAVLIGFALAVLTSRHPEPAAPAEPAER
jgi:Mn2+/Fe2+ NRAMP family transporter